MNPFALFILKEANGFVTLHSINFLTPKSSRPGEMQGVLSQNCSHSFLLFFVNDSWFNKGAKCFGVLVNGILKNGFRLYV